MLVNNKKRDGYFCCDASTHSPPKTKKKPASQKERAMIKDGYLDTAIEWSRISPFSAKKKTWAGGHMYNKERTEQRRLLLLLAPATLTRAGLAWPGTQSFHASSF